MWPILLGGGLLLLIFGAKSVADESNTISSDPFYRYDSLFKKYGAQYGIPWKWLKAISGVESNYGRAASVARGIASPQDVKNSVSSDGKSWGLMQLTLPTARQFESTITEVGLNDPEISIRLAAKYLNWIIKNYWPLSNQEYVIRSYNGGPGFNKTVAGQRDTPAYYQKFLKQLAVVNAAQPD